MTDTDALQRYARRQDPEAFAHLVENYQQMVYAVCLRRLGHEADARDATQDTFLKLAKSAGDIRGSLVGWLHRCATTTSLDLIRKSSRRRAWESAAAEPADASTPAADPTWAELRNILDETLDELPEQQRDLIVQRYLIGRKQNDLAQELGVSESMVSRRIKAAVEDLRRRLGDKGFGLGVSALTTGLVAESAVAIPAGLTAGLTSVGVAGVSAATGSSGVAATAGSVNAGLTVLTVVAGGGLALLAVVGVILLLYFAASAPPGDGPARAGIATTGVVADGRILRPVETGGGSSVSSSTGDAGYVQIDGKDLRAIFKEAYGLTSERYVVFDGDEPRQRYDAEVRGEDWKRVLREALRHELGLVGTLEKRVLTAYALRVPEGGRPRLSPVSPHEPREGGSLTVGPGGALFREASVEWLRLNLEHWLDAPVLDETGINGEFNFLLDAGFNAGFAEYAAAVRDDLGLELVEVPGGREFEVVVVRPSTNPATAISVAGDAVAAGLYPVNPTDPPRELKDLIQTVELLPVAGREQLRVVVFRPVRPDRDRVIFEGTIGQLESSDTQPVIILAGDRVAIVKP